MTERKPLEPVALPNCWADSDTAFYTADQIREAVERVVAEMTRPVGPTDYLAGYDAATREMSSALLHELGLED